MFMYKLQRPHTSTSLYAVSVVKHPPPTQPSFLLLINLMDCEGKVNDFPLTEDALAFTVRRRLQSILQTEIRASINGRDTNKTTGTPLGWWWIQIGSFSGIPGRRGGGLSRVPRIHGFPRKKSLKKLSLRTDGGVSGCINTPVFARKPHFR